jgi:hypothetical protein
VLGYPSKGSPPSVPYRVTAADTPLPLLEVLGPPLVLGPLRVRVLKSASFLDLDFEVLITERVRGVQGALPRRVRSLLPWAFVLFEALHTPLPATEVTLDAERRVRATPRGESRGELPEPSLGLLRSPRRP